MKAGENVIEKFLNTTHVFGYPTGTMYSRGREREVEKKIGMHAARNLATLSAYMLLLDDRVFCRFVFLHSGRCPRMPVLSPVGGSIS